jgi:EAL domain-containing protein (putative c-di-GMP-specific phosphodiesterase class I)
MTPDDFVEIAEETGLIVPIGKWVLDEACKIARQWAIELGYPLRISVNVSARQFDRGVLAEQVNSALSVSGLAPDNLELELTESYVMREPEEAAKVLCKLKDQGVRLALDDFGTGYANLKTLSILPFDTIKIDRGFLKAIPAHREGGAIVLSIIDLAKRLGISVVGEGVETIMQHDFLKNNGCPLGQGYLYAKPLTLKECSEQLGVRV